MAGLALVSCQRSINKPSPDDQHKDDPKPENVFKNIKIVVGEVGATDVELSFYPKDKTKSYFWDICEVSEYNEWGEKAIWKECFDPDYVLTGDDVSDGYTDIEAGTTYVCFAAYCDAAGSILSDVDTVHFTTRELTPEDMFPTSLKGNVNLTIAYAEALYYGDAYDFGNNDWVVYAYDATYAKGVQLEFFKASSSRTPEGTFPIEVSDLGKTGTSLPGLASSEDYLVGTWFYNIDAETSEYADPMAALPVGTAKVTLEAGGTYSIEFTGQDIAGHTVTCSGKGLQVEISDGMEGGSELSVKSFVPCPKLRTENPFKAKRVK